MLRTAATFGYQNDMPRSPLPESSDAIELPGRAGELSVLRGAVSGNGWVVLRGAAGSGTSSLLALAMAGTDALVLRGIAALCTEPYIPLRAAVPHLSAAAEPAEVGAELASLVGPMQAIVVDDVHWCDVDTVGALT